jgi:hypothetical protein
MVSLMFDWMGQTKATWVSAQAVWAMMALVCKDATVPQFGKVKQLCKDYLNRRMERIDMCICGHVAYYDCTHPLLQAPEFQNQYETSCRKCGADRYLPPRRLANGRWAPQKAVKEFFYQPVQFWLQDMFRTPDNAPHLANDGGGPPGSVRKSHGYKRKVLDNPVMNQDHRNQGLIATADNIPCGKNKNSSRSVCPCMIRTTMKDALGLNIANAHLFALVPDQHWVLNLVTGRLRRKKKKTSWLTCVLVRLVDELLTGYHTGFPTIDHSLPRGHPSRKFMLHVLLLFWCGDWPGINEAAGTMSAGRCCCHWCQQRFVYNMALKRFTFCDFGDFLGPDDPLRRPADGPTPLPKTHHQMCLDAEASEAFTGKFEAETHPRFQSGVCWACPLAYLPFFDMVWDFMADWMHISEGYFKEHLIPLLKGKRKPTHPLLKANPEKDRAIVA